MSGIIADNSGRHTGLVKAASAGGVWNLIETLTASSSATLSFTSGIDSTYDEYVFKFINIHPGSTSSYFQFNMSIDSGSNYNVTKTSTIIQAYQGEGGLNPTLNYDSDRDLSQSTAFQVISGSLASNSDDSTCAKLQIFNPSSTVFAKHYLLDTNMSHVTPRSIRFIIAGYANTTSAINAIQFKPLSDAIDSGDICLYGLTT